MILGTRLPEFRHWMNGQTMMLCEGVEWSREEDSYEPSACYPYPHGPIVYASDLRQFLSGRGPVDW